MSQAFPKTNVCCIRNVEIELDLSNCATKADLKGATGVHSSNLAAKSKLASLEAEVNKTI